MAKSLRWSVLSVAGSWSRPGRRCGFGSCRRGGTDDKLVAFGLVAAYLFDMSLAQIKEAVTELSPAELAELASFVCEKDSGAWDSQIDADFAEDGRLRQVLEEVRADVRAGRLEELP